MRCAIEVIAEAGYAQTSIRKIADRVGVAMSAVLYHFGTKDKLVDAVVEEMYRSALAVIRPAVEGETTATGRLEAYIRSNIEYFRTHRVQLLALASLGNAYRPGDGRRFTDLGLNPELAGQLADLDPAPILRDGQRNGEFGDFPVESTAIAMRGAVNAVVEKIVSDPRFDVTGYADDLVVAFGRVVGRTP